MPAPPLVTGISPAEGPPGTVVKIRGENLGKNEKDLLGVFICKMNCTYTADWHSSYILCRTGMGQGAGDIIVVTKSGGKGSSTVKFRGFMPRVGLLTASAVWVDESKLFEEKPTASGMPTSRSMSPTMLSIDPLGVAPEETGNLLPADKIEEMYPKCSGNTLAENFHPARFLLERHLDTSFMALKSGYLHLESHDTRSSSAGPSSFIRKNLGTILESLETLTAVKKAMAENEKEANASSICEEMEGILQNCNSAANNMFQDILTRKDEADVKRNAVSVLQRFKFLFSLRKNTDRKIQQGDYEIVISDYNRAKAFIQNTEVKCFQKVLKDVDARIATFMTQLRTKLFEFPSTLEDRKRIIRYLNDLDYSGDAAWECIEKMRSWLTQLLITCKEEHQKLGHSRSASDGGKSSSLQQLPKKKTNAKGGSMQGSISEISLSGIGEVSPPGRVLFILKVSELIVTHLPDFWKLGQAYLLGQLRKKVSQSTPEDELAKKENSFSGMVKAILKLFDGLVRAAFQSDSLTNASDSEKSNYGGWYGAPPSLVMWLPKCARTIRSCLDSIKSLSIPSELLSPLRKLSNDLCAVTIKEVLDATVADIKSLHTREDWELDYDDENNCISVLPGLFKKMLTNSLHFVREFMAETRIDSRHDQSLKLKEEVAESLKKMVKAFINTLGVILADHLQQEAIKSDSSVPAITSTSSTLSTALSLEERLLILLSNTSYLRNSLLPLLGTRCKDFGYEELEKLSEMFEDDIGKLESEVLSTYIEIKGEPLVGSIEQGMSLGEYRWDEDIPIIGVRSYVREVIMSLVVIHDQVSSISFAYVAIVFSKLGNILSDEIKRIFECQKFSRTGTIQAHLELSVFESSVSQYLSDTARDTFDEARKVLPQLKDGSGRVVEDLVEKFNKEMAYQLSCFTLVDPTPEEPPVIEPPVEDPLDPQAIGTDESNPFLDDDLDEITLSFPSSEETEKREQKEERKLDEKQAPTSNIDIPSTRKSVVPARITDDTKFASPPKGKAPTPPKSKSVAPTPPKSKQKAPSPPRPSSAVLGKEKKRAPSPPRPRTVTSDRPKPAPAKETLASKTSSNPFLDSDEEEEPVNTNPFL